MRDIYKAGYYKFRDAVRVPGTSATVVLVAIAVATLLNGLPFWLKQVGWLDVAPCPHCKQKLEHYQDRAAAEESEFARRRLLYEGFSWYSFARFRPSGAERYLKLAKDLSVFALLLAGVVLGAGVGRGRQVADWLLTGFMAVVALALLYTSLRYDWPVAVAGARAFSFLPIMLLAGRFATDDHLARLARVLAWLLIAQLPLALLELSAPDGLFAGKALGILPWGRAVGTFVHPSALGIFAVCTLSLYACFVSRTSRYTLLLAGSAAVLIVLSGSGTAIILFFATVAWLLGRGVDNAGVQWMVLAAVLLTVVGLPGITGREEIFASAAGRVWALGALLAADMNAWELMMGHGLGVGSNTLITLAREGYVQFPHDEFPGVLLTSIDSTPLALIGQVGVLGCVLFYCLLFRSITRDARARPLLFSVLVASCTINILEFFPVSVMVGLLLARSIRGRLPTGNPVDRTAMQQPCTVS